MENSSRNYSEIIISGSSVTTRHTGVLLGRHTNNSNSVIELDRKNLDSFSSFIKVTDLRTPWLAILGDFREFSISGDAKKSCTIVFGWSKSFCSHVRKSDYVIPYYVIANFVFQKTTYFTIPPAQKG